MTKLRNLPLRRAQRDIYVAQKLSGDTGLSNIGAVIRVVGKLDIDLLWQADLQVRLESAAMRSSLLDNGDSGLQVVYEHISHQKKLLEFHREPDPQEAARQWIEQDFSRGFRDDGEEIQNSFVVLQIGEEEFLVYGKYHHALFDGWGTSLIYDRLCKNYNALRAGELTECPIEVDPLDISENELVYLASTRCDDGRLYWKQRLGDYAGSHFCRPSTLQSVRRVLSLTEMDMVALRNWLQTEQIGEMALFATLLHMTLFRLLAIQDLAIGLPVLNRRTAHEKNTIGLFLGFCVLRSTVLAADTFGNAVRRVAANLKLDFRHQRVPLDELSARAGESPFEVSLSYERHDYDAMFDGTVSNVTPLKPDVQAQALKVFVRDLDRRRPIFIDFDINQSCLGDLDPDLLVETFARALRSVLAAPDEKFIPATTASLGRAVCAPLPTARHLCDVFERAVERHPAAVAVRDAGQAWDYATLSARADALAWQLRGLGVGPETRVGLCGTRDASFALGMLAILKAGGAYVPLDPAYPAERLAFLLADSGVVALLGNTADLDRLGTALPRLCLDAPGLDAPGLDAPGLDAPAVPAGPPPRHSHPDQAAYVIYTSGSTGTPKGCIVSHANVLRLFDVTATPFAFSHRDVWSVFHSTAFDFSVWELWGALLHGAEAVFVPYETSRDPDAFASFLHDRRVSILSQTPSAFRMLASRDERFETLRLVIFGGEALALDSLASWFARNGEQPRLVNMYGITETTVHVTARNLHPRDADAAGSSPIGAPLADLSLQILDRHGQPVPIGVSGEIHVGGPGVTRGYLGQPGLTATRFVPDPDGPPGARRYRAGDLARRRPDGEVVYLGRADDQVKIRGFRIEPAEIEAALRRLPALQDAAVLTDTRTAETRLIAYVVPHPGSPCPDPETLHDALAAILPTHMIPAHCIPLDALPLTLNGKLDRKALPQHPTPQTTSQPPQTPTEIQLATIWADILKIQPGRNDSFFALGGDSILALKIINTARQQGLGITPQQLLAGPTLQKLALDIQNNASPNTKNEARAVSQDAFTLPATPILSWFASLGLSSPDHWAQTMVFEVPDTVRPEALHDALHTLTTRYQSLRQRISIINDEARVTIVAPAEQGAAKQGMVGLATRHAQDDDAVRSHVGEAGARIDLANGPLLQAVLIERHDAPPLLALAVHHAAVDAVSWSILLQDLAALLSEPETSLPPLPAELSDWHRTLDAAAPAVDPLPWLAIAEAGFRDLPRRESAVGPGTEADTLVESVSLDASTTARLLRVAAAGPRSRMQAILLAALCPGLISATGGSHVALTVEHHGRDAADAIEASSLVGWFTALSPLLLECATAADRLDLLASVANRLAAMAARRQDYGLARFLGQDAEARAALDRCGLPEISFNYLGQVVTSVPGGLRLRPDLVAGERAGNDRRSFSLDIVAVILDGVLRMDWRFSPRILDAALIRGCAGAWRAELTALLDAIEAEEPVLAADYPLAQLRQSEVRALLPMPGGTETIAALTPLQEGILFEAAAHAESGAFHEQVTGLVEGPLETRRLAGSWQAMLDRHEALSASFLAREGGRPLQRLGKAGCRLPVVTLDWSDTAEVEQDSRLAALLERDRAQPFDLSRPPLMRLTIVMLAPGRYRWIWSYHHILLDGWSLPIFFRELLTIYRDGGAHLPAPKPFSEHLAWLALRPGRQIARGWHHALSGVTPTLLAPPAREAPRICRIETILDEATGLAVETLSRLANVTKSTVFNAAWALQLVRSGAGADVVFGTTLSGRTSGLSGRDSMLGLFINTLPLRVQLSPADTARTLLAGVQRSQALLHEAEHDRLADVLQASGAETSTLFDTLVVFENYPDDNPAPPFDGLHFARPDYHEHTNFPLSLAIIPGPAIMLRLEHDETRITSHRAQALVYRLVHLLQVLAAMPDAPVARLPLAATDTISSPPPAPILEPRSAYAIFADSAARWPDAVAMAAPAGSIRYDELSRRAEAIARQLARLGAGPETIVGVMLPRSIDAIACLLGILRVGAAYLPLDASYPPDRLDYMLRDSGARIVLCNPDARPSVQVDGVLLVAPAAPGEQEDFALDAPASLAAENLAYVIYTSGSTGQPKAVGVTHAGIEALCLEQIVRFGLRPGSRTFTFAPLSFDASISEIFTTLACGGTLMLPPASATQSDTAAALLQAARRGDVTHVTLPPSLLAALEPEDLAGLETVVVAGEAAPAGLLARWSNGRRVINAYGPTETTVCASMQTCDADSILPKLGEPMQGMHMVVLDPWLHPVPPDVTGEICIGGAGLARGYLRRPGLTATSFLPDPSVPGGRLYRTGDLGVRLIDGSIRYAGRKGSHVKLRGYRIEPDGIVSILLEHPSAREALVSVLERNGRQELVAHVIPAADAADAEAALQDYARRRLAPQEVPSRIILLDTWPLTPSGKIDRTRLPAGERAEPGTGGGTADGAAADPIARMIRDVFRQVLGVADAGLADDYIALGGDSILALQVSAAAGRHGLPIGPGDVLHHRTPTALAAFCRDRVPMPRQQDEPEPEQADIPLLPIQHWFLQRRADQPGHTDRPERLTLDLRLELEATLEQDALQAALRTVWQRHDALRLRMQPASQGWRQFYASRDDAPVLDVVTADTTEESIAEAVKAMQQGLDPVRGPMLRAVLFLRGPAAKPELILVAHHLVMDVVSWHTVLHDLDAAYGAARFTLPPQLLPAGTSVRRWSETLRASTSARLGEAGFWRRMLGDRPDPNFAHTGVAGPVSALRSMLLRLDPANTAGLTGILNQVHGTRPQELLLAALTHAWERWTGGSSLRLDIEGHGRQAQPELGCDLAHTVGWLTCLYPLSFQSKDAAAGGNTTDWDARIVATRDLTRQVPDGGLGFGMLRTHAAATLPDPFPRAVSWNYLGTLAAETARLPALGAWLSETDLPDGRDPDETVLHPLAIDASIRALQGGACLQVRLAASGARLDEVALHRLAECLETSLLQLCKSLSSRADAASASAASSATSVSGSSALGQAELDALMLDVLDQN